MRFHQYLSVEMLLRHSDTKLEVLIDEAITARSNEELYEIKDFLDFLLRENISDETLEELWRSGGSNWNFSPGGHRSVFTYIRDTIAEKLAKKE